MPRRLRTRRHTYCHKTSHSSVPRIGGALKVYRATSHRLPTHSATVPLRALILALSTACTLGITSLAVAQGTLTGIIQGRIVDLRTRRPVEMAMITVAGDTTHHASSTADGRFVLVNIEAGSHRIMVRHVGHAPHQRDNVNVSSGTVRDVGDIALSAAAVTLSTVVVTPGAYSLLGTTSIQTLSRRDISNMSFSEDITRAVARLPGIASNDFSSKFTVRGGESDEVLMTLDGMELLDPFHQRDFAGGLFSIVDIETIDGITLLTGGFPAEYGNRQSGVFDMRTRRVRDGERHTSVGLSLINARLYSDGTFNANKGMYLLSVRRGMLDQTFKLTGRTENTPRFYDAMGKLEYRLSPRHTLSLHGLRAGDNAIVFDSVASGFDKHHTSYGNSYAWLTLTSAYTQRLTSRTLLSAGALSQDRFGSANKYEPSDKFTFALRDARSFGFVALKQDLTFEGSGRFHVKAGFDLRQLKADYSYTYDFAGLQLTPDTTVVNVRTNVNIKQKPTGQLGSGYLSGRVGVTPKLFLESGMRFDRASYANDNVFSPRVSLAYSLGPNTFLRGAWGHYYQSQFLNSLDVNHGATSFNPAELSKHFVVGFEHLFENGIGLRVEGYRKGISRISPTYMNLRDPWEVFPEARNDVVRVDARAATAQGVELFLKRDLGGKVSWWLSYALARAEDDIRALQFDGVVEKRTGRVPRPNNQTHTIYADVNYRPSTKWHTSVSWQFYNGQPLTKYTFGFVTLPNGDLHFSALHSAFRAERYPAYHRMDVRVNRHFDVGRGRLSAYVHVINAYNRRNLRKFDLDTRNSEGNHVPDGRGGFLYPRDDKTWLGLVPAVGISWEF